MLDSLIRTTVTLIVGVLLGQALKVGLNLDEGAVTSIVTVVVTTVYYAAARWLEQQWPLAGRILLGAGVVDTQPVYRAPQSSAD